jgi:hypothetical protein
MGQVDVLEVVHGGDVGDYVAVREHHPFGNAGGTLKHTQI